MNDDTNTSLDEETTNQEPAAPTIDTEAIIAAKVAEELAGMKENMNKMSKQRDEAMKRAVSLEEEQKAAKIAQLEAEGKTNEATQLKLDEALTRLEEREKQLTGLTRDHNVDSILSGQDFRNSTAKDMAKQLIIGQLKQDSEGHWVHATGESISDFVQAFAKDEENAFLFKQKQSSGAAAMQQGLGGTPEMGKSDTPITELSFEDFMKNNPMPSDSHGF